MRNSQSLKLSIDILAKNYIIYLSYIFPLDVYALVMPCLYTYLTIKTEACQFSGGRGGEPAASSPGEGDKAGDSSSGDAVMVEEPAKGRPNLSASFPIENFFPPTQEVWA